MRHPAEYLYRYAQRHVDRLASDAPAIWKWGRVERFAARLRDVTTPARYYRGWFVQVHLRKFTVIFGQRNRLPFRGDWLVYVNIAGLSVATHWVTPRGHLHIHRLGSR